MADNDGHWSKQEIDVGSFKDVRLARRCTELLRQLGEHTGGSIPFACQDWANTKAAYRFFSNPNVEEGDILNGHFAATAQRYDASMVRSWCSRTRPSLPISAAIRMQLALRRASTVAVTNRSGCATIRSAVF
ncbi:transposase DNA-binding-containing protein [Rhizobium etli]|uniref:IS4/Tn5 family transposase DNA-binding protein n=1 Tax=Rhizobium etli TaxID=29449 RepID=UPI0030844F8C